MVITLFISQYFLWHVIAQVSFGNFFYILVKAEEDLFQFQDLSTLSMGLEVFKEKCYILWEGWKWEGLNVFQ